MLNLQRNAMFCTNILCNLVANKADLFGLEVSFHIFSRVKIIGINQSGF